MTSPGDDTTQLSDDDVIIVDDAVHAALKEFADRRIDLKVLAAQVLLQRVESSYTETPNREPVGGPVG
jgi:hypothetical protein